LLASNSQAAKGLGNDHDVVGRYFMEHLEIPSAELWLLKPFSTNLYSLSMGTTKARAELGITEKMQIEHRILNGTASLRPLATARMEKPRMQTFQDDDPRKSYENMRREYDKTENESDQGGSIDYAYQLDTRIEQAPNPNSRVTLGSERDELGVPRADLHWELTSLERRSIRKIYELLGQQVGAAGIGRIRLREFLRDETDTSWPVGTNAGWHHMGTTRMCDDPKRGVVDAQCRVHGLSNLYVAGSGCYVTAAAPNPTLTLVALSLRLSDYLRQQVGKG
jgi:GMC oxidoreductase